jgi:hypothetical protein
MSDRIKFECDELREEDIKSISFNDSSEIHEKVFAKLLEWHIKMQAFNGESIMQCDETQLTASELLSDIADDIIQFEVEYE